jgi:uncharacterized linocin/CFP29 family protein
MSRFTHASDPLTASEWPALNHMVKTVGGSTIARKIIEATGPLGAGIQTVPDEYLVGITEGYISILGSNGSAIKLGNRNSGIVPLIFKDFIIHWRDVEESRLTGQEFSKAKAAAAASSCARAEDKLVLFGHDPLGYSGLMTAEGRNTVEGLEWKRPGDAFRNFTEMIRILAEGGHSGPYAAVVHPRIYTDMHRVLTGSSLLEIAHVRALLTSGVFRSELLFPNTGLVIATGKQNFEMVISVDTSAAFLGARRMNLPFRVFKAIYLRIRRSDAICTFVPI